MQAPVKGIACLQCRRHKVKCSGTRPECSRCRRLHKECEYPPAKTRDKPRAELEARALELEIIVNKLAISPSHDLSLTSGRLLDRVRRIGTRAIDRQQSVVAIWLPMYPHFEDLTPTLRTSAQVGQLLLGREVTEGYSPLIHRSVVEHALDSCQLEGENDDLPPLASRYLISLFLPHRSRFHFFMDSSYFLRSLSLPSSRPESIHPCLRYACYLAACIMTGGRLTSLQPYMLAKTRHFLDQSLMFADRLTHFLWASMILTCCMVARMRRLEEAFAIVSSAARLATACGLTRNGTTDVQHNYLLLPSKDEFEADDRLRLARSIYLTDQVLATLSGFSPTFRYDGPEHKIDKETGDSGSRHSAFQSRISSVNLFEEQVVSFENSIPLPSDPLGLEPFEAVTSAHPHIFFAYITMYGSGIVLHSLKAGKDPHARQELLKNLRSLINLCVESRGAKRLKSVQGGLPSIRHIMNAIRLLAHELRGPEARENIRLSVDYCETIELLLDFLDDMMVSYPTWADAPAPLADVITSAVNVLTT
ncbi:hypothetical protein DL93DRAFT_515399 [Clavulina sp. PMI_390]|nr:hypothetical protein DL93DRAFT_515399 [Clavulina sp. PMI_390]